MGRHSWSWTDFSASYTFTCGTTSFGEAQRFSHPSYNGLNFNYDIGLVRLNTAVPAITPTTRFFDNTEEYFLATTVGFGATAIAWCL